MNKVELYIGNLLKCYTWKKKDFPKNHWWLFEFPNVFQDLIYLCFSFQEELIFSLILMKFLTKGIKKGLSFCKRSIMEDPFEKRFFVRKEGCEGFFFGRCLVAVHKSRVGFWAVIFHRPTLLGGFQSRTEKDQGLLHNITTKTVILSLCEKDVTGTKVEYENSLISNTWQKLIDKIVAWC